MLLWLLQPRMLCKRQHQRNAFIRPPGHHAHAEHMAGFCLINNVAVAAKYLLKHHAQAISKVLILDVDVHHGDGTQSIFQALNDEDGSDDDASMNMRTD